MAAGADRDVTIDIVGRDKTGASTKSATRNYEQLRTKTKAANDEADKGSKKWDQWGKSALSAGKAAGALGAKVAAVGSLAGPATTGLLAAAKGAAAFAKGAASVGAELAPLVAYVPALAGSVGLLVGTLKLAGPGLSKALQPVTSQFVAADGGTTKLTAHIQALASKGLQPLAKSFVKVNLPTIAAGMGRIAVAEDKVLVGVGKWVNSAPGQSLVRKIVGDTATAAEQLGPHLQSAVIAVANLARQAVGVGNLGGAVGKILDKFTNWANSIDGHDINAAFATILRGWGDIQTAWGKLQAVVQWMSANQGKIKAFSSSLAAIGIVFGAATGDLPAVAAGAFSLIFNNIDKVKGALKGVDTSGLVKDFDNVKDAARNFIDAGKDIASTFGPLVESAIGPASGALKDFSTVTKDVFGFLDSHKTTFQAVAVGLAAMYTWTKLLAVSEWAAFAAQTALDVAMDANPIGLVVLAIAGLVAAFAYLWTHSSGFRDFWITIWDAIKGAALAVAGWFAGPFVGAMKAVWNVIVDAIKVAVDIILDYFGFIIHAAADAFGWIPGIGPKLKGAAAEFDKFKTGVNNALDGIKAERDVLIKITKTGNGASLVDNQGSVRVVGGGRNIAQSAGTSWAPARTAAQFITQTFALTGGDTDGGTSRTGGPTPVHVDNTVTVALDGAPFRAMTVRTVSGALNRRAWRERVGAR